MIGLIISLTVLITISVCIWVDMNKQLKKVVEKLDL